MARTKKSSSCSRTTVLKSEFSFAFIPNIAFPLSFTSPTNIFVPHSFFIVEADGEIPEELVGCAKILMMPLDEFKSTVLEGKKLPSTKLTVEVQKVLRELLESRLATYTSDSKV